MIILFMPNESPRVWGTCFTERKHRFTPTGVGNKLSITW